MGGAQAGTPVPPDRSWLPAGLAMFGVGWGANQFASLLGVYRVHEHLSQAAVTAIFGCYALGLIPALLVAGPVSDRRGRRAVVRPVLVTSLVASLLLVAGRWQVGLLFAGRFLAGAASGAAFGPGSAWIAELSAGAPGGAGARRATVCLSAGFGAGPLVAGLVAQWAPLPELVPYLVHVALMLAVIPLAWTARETVRSAAPAGPRARRLRGAVRAAGQPEFLRVVAPAAPWVFGLPSISFTVVPTFVAGHTAGLSIAFTAAITGLTLLSGIAVQPLATRLEHRRPGLGLPTGLLAAAGGLGVSAVVALSAQPLLVVPAAMVLGSGYGMLLVSGLRETQRLAAPGELAGLVAVFYALTYLGFAAPYLLAELAPHLGDRGYSLLLAAAAAVTLGTAAAIRGRASQPRPAAVPESR